MQKRALLALLLAAAMLLTGCKLIVKDEAVDNATEIVKVYDAVYTKGQVKEHVAQHLQQDADYYNYMNTMVYSQYGVDYNYYMYKMTGQYVDYSVDVNDEETIRKAQEEVCKDLVDLEVKKHKAAELGASLDEADMEAVNKAYLAYYPSQASETDLAAKGGIFYEALCEEKLDEKLTELTGADLTVTDEETRAEYDSRLAKQKETFDKTPSTYCNQANGVATAESTYYYRPAGVRRIRQILIQYSEDEQKKVSELEEKVSAETSSITSLTSTLTDAGVEDVDALTAQVTVSVKVSGTDVTATSEKVADATLTEENADTVIQLAEATARRDAYQKMLEEAENAAYATIEAEAKEVAEAAKAGGDWDALVAEHNDDPGMKKGAANAETGYAVCEGYAAFDSAFVDAAMALEKVGDVSDPVKGASSGYYILLYAGDEESGEVAYETLSESLNSELLKAKKDSNYEALVEQWNKEAEGSYSIDYNSLRN